MRVLPDVAGIDKQFDYVVPEAWDADDRGRLVQVGSIVRIALHGRRVGGWVVATDVEPPAGVRLQPLAKVSGLGPPADVVDRARWVAHRWAGRWGAVLRSASPHRNVQKLPAPRTSPTMVEPFASGLATAFDKHRAVVRLAPATDVYPVVLEAARRGNALIVAPDVAQARHLGVRLRRAGVPVAIVPDDWAAARAGATVIGARTAALAPVVDLAAVVVLDEHVEALQEERNPTWHARDVAIERADRAGVPCVLVSPSPTLEALQWGPLLKPARAAERRGWPRVDIIDRRDDDPVRGGLLSEHLTEVLRGPAPVVGVLNRKGRSRRLACAFCGELARHEPCGVPFRQEGDAELLCPSCGETRPVICAFCGAGRFKNLRAGVSRLREEVEALALRPVVEITGDSDDVPPAEIYLGTEAVLHRVPRARAVVFFDFDQELLAPRYRAAEQAMALLIRAARMVGERGDGGRVVVQTRLPSHPVLDAARHADPSRFAEAERERRRPLQQPPFSAQAEVSGAAAAEFAARAGTVDTLTVLGPLDDRYLIRAATSGELADGLAYVERPSGRFRVAVDPPRV
ncbi:MAG: hypothetical protein HKN26_02675 [Acidimicrobiales bacterium]|nr:hypothetical protein [Acidimicrobiales bacterium]